MMAQSGDSQATASSVIPYVCRFLLLNVEPLFAANGAILLLLKPETYISTMTRGMAKSIDSSINFLNTELAGGWLHFAFTEAIVLRLVDDVRTWRLLCMGMLLSDIAYCHSCAEAVGGWSAWLVVSDWTVEDWVVAITTWPFLMVRFAIVLGIGLKDQQMGVRKE